MGTIYYLGSPNGAGVGLRDMRANAKNAPHWDEFEENGPGIRLAEARAAAHVSQERLAEYCRVSRTTIASYERGANRLSRRNAKQRETIRQACVLLGVSESRIWDGTDTPTIAGVEKAATNVQLVSLLLDVLQDPATTPDLKQKTRSQIDQELGLRQN